METADYKDVLLQKRWPLENASEIKEKHLMEHVCDLKVPNIFKGKSVSILISFFHDCGNWKRDWHFEGISVIINSADKIK